MTVTKTLAYCTSKQVSMVSRNWAYDVEKYRASSRHRQT